MKCRVHANGVRSNMPYGSETMPLQIWLESIETDMTKLEIDREDVNDRKKWRNNVMK